MTPPDAANPFHIWADLARGLRDRIIDELKAGPDTEIPPSPYMGELLGSIVALATRCNHIGAALETLRQKQPAEYTAFLRAMEKV